MSNHPELNTNPDTIIDCPSCGKVWNISKFNSCECGAVLKIGPPTAGPLQDAPSLPKQEGEPVCKICGVPAPDHTPFCPQQDEGWTEASTPPKKNGYYNIITEGNCFLISAYQNGEWDYNLETVEMVSVVGMGTADRVARYRPCTYQPIEDEQEPDGPVQEGQFTQAFEEFADLTTFIEQMASSGMIPHGSGWTSFLYELNKICADLCAANAQIEALKQALEKQNLHILGHIKKRQDLEAQLSAANARIQSLTEDLHESLIAENNLRNLCDALKSELALIKDQNQKY